MSLKGQRRVLKIGVFGKLIKIGLYIYYIIENSLLLHEFVFKYVQYIYNYVFSRIVDKVAPLHV